MLVYMSGHAGGTTLFELEYKNNKKQENPNSHIESEINDQHTNELSIKTNNTDNTNKTNKMLKLVNNLNKSLEDYDVPKNNLTNSDSDKSRSDKDDDENIEFIPYWIFELVVYVIIICIMSAAMVKNKMNKVINVDSILGTIIIAIITFYLFKITIKMLTR